MLSFFYADILEYPVRHTIHPWQLASRCWPLLPGPLQTVLSLLINFSNRKRKSTRRTVYVFCVQEKKNLILSSSKKLSSSKLCRKCNFRTYPVAQPLRTEELEEGSASFWIRLCSVGCLWTELFELDRVSCQFCYFYLVSLYQINLKSDMPTWKFCKLVTVSVKVHLTFPLLLLDSHFLLLFLMSLFKAVFCHPFFSFSLTFFLISFTSINLKKLN